MRGTDLGGSDQDLSVLGSAQVVDNAHQVERFGSGLLRLGHMQIHFVAVKICIVRAADALVEA